MDKKIPEDIKLMPSPPQEDSPYNLTKRESIFAMWGFVAGFAKAKKIDFLHIKQAQYNLIMERALLWLKRPQRMPLPIQMALEKDDNKEKEDGQQE